MKKITENTHSYILIHNKNCASCGETNKYFRRTWSRYKEKKTFSIGKLCRDCWLERYRIWEREYRKTDKSKISDAKYRLANKEKIRIIKTAIQRRYTARKIAA